MENKARNEDKADLKNAFLRARRKGADVWHDMHKYYYDERIKRAELAEQEFIARFSRSEKGDFELC